jgi:hypothetical protein
MRTRRLAFLLAAPLGVFVACVGYDPAPADVVPDDDAGPLGPDGSLGNADSATGRDAAGDDGSAPADAGADTAPPPFDVRSMAGLRLWLESTKELVPESAGSTGFGSWTDSSGRWDGGSGGGAPDGGKHVAVPFDVNPPAIVANGIAGRPTVSFIAGNGYLSLDNHADFQFGTGDFVIAEVAKITSGNGPLWVLRPNQTAGSEESFLAGQFCFAFGLGVMNACTTPVFTPSTEPHVFVARRKSDVFTLRVDGSTRGTVDSSTEPPNIGVNQFAQPFVFIGNNSTMQVSEVIVIVGPTADPSLEALEGHLKTKYLIP